MSLGAGNLLLASAVEGYNLTRSLRTRANASAYLNRTPASAGSQTTWTWSAWIKRGLLTYGGSGSVTSLFGWSNSVAGQSGTIAFSNSSISGVGDNISLFQGANNYRATNAVLRDPSAWYHIVVVWDSTNATDALRARIYVNGVLQTYALAPSIALNTTLLCNSTVAHNLAADPPNGGSVRNFFDGYLAEINFIDGQALTPSSFGSTNALTGVWQPARYAGTYGTNGFYLPFTDNSALTTSSNVGLGKDFSGNGNYWTTNNISITSGVTYDSMTDVPTLTSATAANFAVFNPLEKTYNTGTPSNGNLTSVSPTTNGATIAIPTDGNLYYFEFANINAINTSGDEFAIGVHQPNNTAWWYNSSSSNAWVAYASAGGGGGSWQFINNGTQAFGNGGGTPANTTFGCAVKYSGGTWSVYISRAGVWYNSSGTALGSFTSGSPTSTFSYTGILVPFGNGNANFGQRPFIYTPPTGFVALNTYNLPTSTILKGNKVMDATLYTGNGSTQTITNAAGFKPDLVWVKGRSSSAQDHTLVDSVRGVSRRLRSNATTAEVLESGFNVTAFNSSGFTAVDDTNGSYNVNGSVGGSFSGAAQYVGYQWQAGQGSTSSNTSGTITSTVSVNASAGFSVVTYTGTGANATVGHGLGVAPQMVIIKQRTSAGTNWTVWHSGLTSAAYYLSLNTVEAQANNTGVWNNTAPSSSVFSLGGYAVNNGSTATYVAYCWTPIAGYSAFGSVLTNSTADNAFVYTGFLPRFILFKRSDSTSDWGIFDTARNTYNIMGNLLNPNLSSAESSVTFLDVVSNGFKFRSSGFGGTWIYAAFASNPFKNSLAF